MRLVSSAVVLLLAAAVAVSVSVADAWAESRRRRLLPLLVISSDFVAQLLPDSASSYPVRASFEGVASCLADDSVRRITCAPGSPLFRFVLAFLRWFYHMVDAPAVNEQSTPSTNRRADHSWATRTYYAAIEHVVES